MTFQIIGWATLFIILSATCMTLWIFERSERKSYEKLFHAYKELNEKNMENFQVCVNLSESLMNRNDELMFENDELEEALDEKKKVIEDKEAEIDRLEKVNERLCQQIKDMFRKEE